MSHSDGGKGSGRRKEDASKVRDNWDLIFGAKKGKTMMNEHDDDEHDHEDGEWTCDSYGGPVDLEAAIRARAQADRGESK